MPINYARRLSGVQRSRRHDLHLGVGLAFVAGATNAGAFLAVGRYTSHMTGVVSAAADAVALGQGRVALGAAGAVLAFVAGAATTAVIVNFGHRHQLRSAYAQPLLLEALLLGVFGVLGAQLSEVDRAFVPLTVVVLCFMMGLQNAVITKISKAEIRTTHMTGIITDLGIELGRMVYVNRAHRPGQARVAANRARAATLGALLGAFLAGGVLGAYAFQQLGYAATLPLAAVLVALAIVPVVDDLRARGGA